VTRARSRSTLSGMSASRPVPGQAESPEVAALRKRIRGEPLSREEEALLASVSRRPEGPTVPHEAVMRELAERERRDG
jgi:hypothetical protein